MAEQDDMALLRDFADNGSEAAFSELVKRHLNMVYSSALRRVGDPHEAEDVAQVVFLILARKAKTLSPRTVLADWLYEATRFTSKKLPGHGNVQNMQMMEMALGAARGLSSQTSSTIPSVFFN